MSSSPEQVRIWRLSKRGTEPPYHGTKHIYDAYGCRCEACRVAVARKRRQWYWSQRGAEA
jgi:hypothetical protein